MLSELFFKCADGAEFQVKITHHDPIEGGVGEITIYNESGDQVVCVRFYNEASPVWGKYSVLSRMIKKAGIFNHGGISRAGSQMDFPYHAANFDIHVRNEQKIRRSLQLMTKHWGSVAVANRTYKHKFADK